MKNLIIDDVHGNSKAVGSYKKRITVVSSSWAESKKVFAELYELFSNAYGSVTDIDTESFLSLKQKWSYQLDLQQYQHRFFISNDEQHSFFLLKYSDQLTHWSK